MVCPQIGTAVLKALRPSCCLVKRDESAVSGHLRSWIDSRYSYHVLQQYIANDIGLVDDLPSRVLLILRGALVNRTCGIHKKLYIKLFLPTIFGPINYGSP